MKGFQTGDGNVYFAWWNMFGLHIGACCSGVILNFIVNSIRARFWPKQEEESEEVEYEEEESYEEEEYYEEEESIIVSIESVVTAFEISFDAFGDNCTEYMNQILDVLMTEPTFAEMVHDKALQANDEDNQGTVRIVIGYVGTEEDLMDKQPMKDAMEYLMNEQRIQNVTVINTNEDDAVPRGDEFEGSVEWQDIVELQFNTTAEEDINQYHQELTDAIMNIEGLAEKVHNHSIEVVDDNHGKMVFLLYQSPDSLMDDPVIQSLLELMRNEDGIGTIDMNEGEPVQAGAKEMRKFDEDEEEDAGEELLELSFKTKGEDIESYHNDLLGRIMALSGFASKYHSHDVEVISHKKGKMSLILKQEAETAMSDAVIQSILELLENENRVKKINFEICDDSEVIAGADSEKPMTEFKEADDEFQELLELTFKTKGEDIESYHADLLKRIMAISGFKEKLHSHEVKAKSEKKGTMKFVLKQEAETAMAEPCIKALLALLENENRVKKVNFDEAEPIRKSAIKKEIEEFVEEEEEVQYQELVELTFKTECGPNAVIQVYNEALLKRIMDVPGFYDLVYDYNAEVINDRKGTMMFVIKHQADTAMDNPAIKEVMAILTNNESIKKVDIDETAPMEVHSGEVRVKKQTHLTHAILISFTLKCDKEDNVQKYSDELIAEFEQDDYFKYKMYQKKITNVKDYKAKFQLIMYCNDKTDNAEEDPELTKACAFLETKEMISALKVETIPYFLES